MSIGSFRCVVINVTDLQKAYEFWSQVTGYEVIGRHPEGWHGRFGYLGRSNPRKHEIILQVVDSPKGEEANRVHIDITPTDGVDRAIKQIVAFGGSVKKPPSLYPRPGSYGDPPAIDWAVMRDPFGNEFCLVSELRAEEIAAVLAATEAGACTDAEWRAAAGRTSPA
jgi:catechol 2,3-dioxygenase-like lactoylglutathione lyase family enzyme